MPCKKGKQTTDDQKSGIYNWQPRSAWQATWTSSGVWHFLWDRLGDSIYGILWKGSMFTNVMDVSEVQCTAQWVHGHPNCNYLMASWHGGTVFGSGCRKSRKPRRAGRDSLQRTRWYNDSESTWGWRTLVGEFSSTCKVWRWESELIAAKKWKVVLSKASIRFASTANFLPFDVWKVKKILEVPGNDVCPCLIAPGAVAKPSFFLPSEIFTL